MARFLHDCSPRASKPFVAINCGAIPENLIESELFGHERGAFSGATERRVGRFEAANRGTLLLDEISEMPLALQTRLLRVLQEREIHRVGASAPTPIDVRIIATSNRDLKQMVREGTFREDLYYRLNVFPIHLPPLRERLEDLPALSQAILDTLSARFGRSRVTIDAEALEVMMASTWAGNVRELNNVLERALIINPSELIQAEHIILDTDAGFNTACAGPEPAQDDATNLAEMERRAILSVLERLDGNRTLAAAELGISIRTLRNRLRDYRQLGVVIPAPVRGVVASERRDSNLLSNEGGRHVAGIR
jgi:transcriptional regulator with PAS, ATPase and Fis domain